MLRTSALGVKTNVTLRLDRDLLRDAQALAAERGSSISELVTECLAQVLGRPKAHELARRRALARLREGLDLRWMGPQSRDELHER